ncbi:MAG: hypothetical protein AVDCRST_MAG71-1039 [uncultured Lysobacter sp.]|uniref:Uncharacterized protein n=1 Tax=uncultured Lysobacter sp. TaxID=271060 RepID=A0A6J4KW98_9GAMM|nr:MAG: hypothetical protein AVDCRST_MAG71-1039 [uncultured Lysobacter sp.]
MAGFLFSDLSQSRAVEAIARRDREVLAACSHGTGDAPASSTTVFNAGSYN